MFFAQQIERQYCPSASCNAAFMLEEIDVKDDEDMRILCPECLKLFCRICKKQDECICQQQQVIFDMFLIISSVAKNFH